MRNLLVVCKDAPISDNGSAGTIRLYQILTALSKEYDLYVLCKSADYGTKHLESLGCKYIKVNQNIDKSLLELPGIVKTIDVALISFWHMAELYMPIINKMYHPKIVIDTVDVEFLRIERKNSYFHTTDIGINKDREIAVYKNASCCFTISLEDNERLNKEADVYSEIIPLIYDIGEFEPKNNDKVIPNSMYFLGNFLHHPNVDSVRYILSEVFPKIKEKFNDVKIFIAGKHVPVELKSFESDSVHFIGAQYELKKFLNTMELAMMPLVYGSGQNGKIAEAMINQIPVITNNIGAIGIQLTKGIDALVGETADEIVNQYTNFRNMKDNERQYLIRNAYYSAKEKFNSKVIKMKILEVVNRL